MNSLAFTNHMLKTVDGRDIFNALSIHISVAADEMKPGSQLACRLIARGCIGMLLVNLSYEYDYAIETHNVTLRCTHLTLCSTLMSS